MEPRPDDQDIVDVYSTDEPQTVFHQRIQFCLKHHNDFIRAMRFPKDAHRKVLEAVKKSGERMREIEQEIEEAEGGVDGDNMDDF
ncbi:MAG: proteasome regulatory subunit C-terminal-domain-containing protein [Olpidium bornovanus]|uniref:Proteasome regulatory subunit C-terminal-domain-containing protein n=1 Tax=Olpidium bornovanus TaxID=278681 RepID=A0A8H8A067_9FUNG|nr:MAG: proteasome regulatory subunit C-terminal-domain-containing protein [Olpidium bornovanus]